MLRSTSRTRLALEALALLIVALALAGCTGGSEARGDVPATSYQGTELSGQAADFSLTDHTGTTRSLSDFRGKVAVLAFMDMKCDETCPLTSLELRAADDALGDNGGRVAFLGVNVNKDFNTVSDARLFSGENGLLELSDWHFMTGSPTQLAAVWRDYNIEVRAEPGEDDYDHTPGIFIIDQSGTRRWYVSTPLLGEGLIGDWTGPSLREIIVQRVTQLLN